MSGTPGYMAPEIFTLDTRPGRVQSTTTDTVTEEEAGSLLRASSDAALSIATTDASTHAADAATKPSADGKVVASLVSQQHAPGATSDDALDSGNLSTATQSSALTVRQVLEAATYTEKVDVYA
jgi:hypothetical protein